MGLPGTVPWNERCPSLAPANICSYATGRDMGRMAGLAGGSATAGHWRLFVLVSIFYFWLRLLMTPSFFQSTLKLCVSHRIVRVLQNICRESHCKTANYWMAFREATANRLLTLSVVITMVITLITAERRNLQDLTSAADAMVRLWVRMRRGRDITFISPSKFSSQYEYQTMNIYRLQWDMGNAVAVWIDGLFQQCLRDSRHWSSHNWLCWTC